MLQYLYNETGAAAQEIVEKVAPEVNSVSKAEIKEAATERAKEIAADVAKADETINQDQHSAIVEACSQVIYAQVCSDLARIQASDNMESLFSEETVDEYYADQDTYGARSEMVKGAYKMMLRPKKYRKEAADSGVSEELLKAYDKGVKRSYAITAGAGVAGGAAGALAGNALANRKIKKGNLTEKQAKALKRKYRIIGGISGAAVTAGATPAALGLHAHRKLKKALDA